MDNQDFRRLLEAATPAIAKEAVDRIVKFRDLVVEESERQNLTRLLSPTDFYEGHVLDALELLKTGFLRHPVMDLGSGMGAPGLLCAIIGGGQWILVDSEKKKAEFLARAKESLFDPASDLEVAPVRAEDFLKKRKVETIVARAVGPVDRIYGWLRKCSTWNTLVLMKGPAWEQEWAQFQATGLGKHLKCTGTHDYRVGAEQKVRIIVRLERTPASFAR